MEKISCIIVDDEPLALARLEKYVLMTPFLKLAGQCDSAFQALKILHNTAVQVLFLDIQMPELNGIELSRIVDKNTRIIFTTAFDQYAIEGFKVNALDYLLKPFNYEEFLAAANRAKEWVELTATMVRPASEQYIFIRSDYKQVKILLNEVLYFEGFKDYIKIWLINSPRPILTLMSLKALEKELPLTNFMRIHRSFIISLNKIQAIDRNHVIINKTVRILIAGQYKDAFQNFVSSRSIG